MHEYYQATMGTAATPPIVQREIARYLQEGMEPDIIVIALDETAMAPYPSWRYTRAILARCAREGIKTAEQYYHGQAARSAAGSRPRNPLPGQDYAQREYDNERMAYLAVDWATMPTGEEG